MEKLTMSTDSIMDPLKVQEVLFDGHGFDGTMGQYIAALRLVYDARRGDAVAAELLNSFHVTVRTVDGGTYWPMEAKPDAVVQS